jgi:hypothetical protein
MSCNTTPEIGKGRGYAIKWLNVRFRDYAGQELGSLGFSLRHTPCLWSLFSEFSRGAKNLAGTPSVVALTQRGVKSLFPTDVVDGPADLRFVPCGEM